MTWMTEMCIAIGMMFLGITSAIIAIMLWAIAETMEEIRKELSKKKK